jgi:AcrR family transcriptional regulator
MPHIKIEPNGSVNIVPLSSQRPGCHKVGNLGIGGMEQDTQSMESASPAEDRDPPQDSAKRRQILEGARAVFLSQGFDRASMDEIARAAGVSKGTLYVYFNNKQRLFEELIIEDRRAQAEQIIDFDPADPDIRGVLTRFGVSLCKMMQRPQTVALVRTVIAASGQFPNIGRTLYAAGPAHGIQRLSRYFDAQVASGRLSMPDTELAAAQFLDLSLCRLFKPLLFSVTGPASIEKIEANINSAVDIILAYYGPKAEPVPSGT